MRMRTLILIAIISLLSINIFSQNIYRTACQGDLIRLDSMLNHALIDDTDDRGRSLLHWTVACNQKEIFSSLVHRGININIEDNDGFTPLHMAVRFENDSLFDAILELQEKSDWTIDYGAELLEKAVLNKNLVFVQKLIENGVEVDITNDRGSTALEIASRMKTNEISEYLISKGADKNKMRIYKLRGEYLGQAKPGLTPQVFAPNFISTEESEFGSVFNALGTEFYYSVDHNGRSETRFSKLINNHWSTPTTILSHDRYGYNDPFLSPDENRLYVISERALDGIGESKDHDIWYVERKGSGWSEPINAGSNINSAGNEYYISFTDDGTMYFASNVNAPEERKRSDLDIYYSKFIDGKFQEAVPLGDSINTPDYEADVFVAPDESYIIFCSIKEEGLGRGDLYISFKKDDGQWSKAVTIGDIVNTEKHELCPYVTNDGKYLFYTSNQDIYWVSTKIIDDIKEKR